jgi:hypothetical protein
MKKQKPGRPTKISYSLMRRLAGHLHAGCDIKTSCNLCHVGTQTFRDWKERAENGEEPYTKLFSVASRARDGFKAHLLKIVVDAARRDAKFALWLLERGWPNEYGAFGRRPVPLPTEPQPPPDLSRMVKFTCGNVDLGEFMEIEAKYKAMKNALGLRDEPVTVPAPESEANGHRPIVGAGGRVIGWTDSDDSDLDRDAEP